MTLGARPAPQLNQAMPKLNPCADDCSDNITLLTRYLENDGDGCLTAEDGKQALTRSV